MAGSSDRKDKRSDWEGRPRVPEKTVYIIGTGFSRPLGLPTVSEFIPEGLRLLADQALSPSNSKRRSHDALKDLTERQAVFDRYIPMLRLVELEHREPTVEDVFCAVDLLDTKQKQNSIRGFVWDVCNGALSTHVEAEKTCLGNKGPIASSGTIQQQHAFPPRIDQVHLDKECLTTCGSGHLFKDGYNQKNETVCPYVAFLSHVIGASRRRNKKIAKRGYSYDQAADAIISLNYDLVIEEKMQQLFPKDRVSSGISKVYYGHAVVDKTSKGIPYWLNVTTPGMADLPLIKLHGSFNWSDIKKTDKVRISTKAGNKSLVWPTWVREPFEKVFQKLLHEARMHLHLASSVVFIGYSMPTSDRYFRYLLAEAFNTPRLPEVKICEYKKDKEDVHLAWQRLLGILAKRTKVEILTDGFVEYVRKWKPPSMNDQQSA